MTAPPEDDDERTVRGPPAPMTVAELPAATRVETPKVEVDDEATRVNPKKAEDDESTRMVPKAPPVSPMPNLAPPPAPLAPAKPIAKARPPRKPVPPMVVALVLVALGLMIFGLYRDRTAERPEDAKRMRPAEEDKRSAIEKFFDG